MKINYDDLLNEVTELVYKECDKCDKVMRGSPVGSYKNGRARGMEEGMLLVVAMINRKEQKFAKK